MKGKTLMDRLPKDEETKPVQADIPLSKRDRFLRTLDKNNHTQQMVIEAAVDQYLEENEVKK